MRGEGARGLAPAGEAQKSFTFLAFSLQIWIAQTLATHQQLEARPKTYLNFTP